ncbi:hypothetical protein P8S54_07145 [Thiomicrospira sp. R3]|uniref:hypothetical protein n=1 Tax=Thiomicrospira sp. R3 TaxID=3035472 RepID=UPI00259B0417|nr:hypothetical protein [Thiomicrospira sp. R3]WFE68001.1 hypothetical protein P8S54_07145 [Thiomicrospira sp. R3]
MNAQNTEHDWEEELSKIVGDPLAFQIGYRVRRFQDQTRQLKQDGEQMLSEYLRYELDLLPARSEVEGFNQAVTELETQVEALEARIVNLSAKKGF